MSSSRRYSLHLERSTSVGDIGSSCNTRPSIDDDYFPTIARKKIQRQPTVMKPSQTTNTELKNSKPAEQPKATRLSQGPTEPTPSPSNLLKQAAPAMAGLVSHVSAANSMSKDEKQHSTPPRRQVIESIFFIASPERELAAGKKIEDDDELGLFGEFIKKCSLCKKEFKPDKDVYMCNDSPFCSSDCRDDRIALDGFKRTDFGLGKEDQKAMKSLRKDLNKLHTYLQR